MNLQGTDQERSVIGEFLAEWGFVALAEDGVSPDTDLPSLIVKYVEQRFSSMKYILGLAIDFVVLAQLIANADPNFEPLEADETASHIFKRYELVTKRGTKIANTLSLRCNGKTFGIRGVEETVASTFHKMGRTDYPSAYVYNTGQWHKYADLLKIAFSMGDVQRYAAIMRLWEFGLRHLDRQSFAFPPKNRIRSFEALLGRYPRSAVGENGGLAFQAISYGWCTGVFAHLDIVADKVRTGSKRQQRIGDFDAYWGIPLELTVEVKDMHLAAKDYAHQIGQFAEVVRTNGIHGLVLARSFDDEVARRAAEDGVKLVDVSEMLRIASLWDWQLQDRALLNFFHYLSHIEQNPHAVQRAIGFIAALDPEHRVVAWAGRL